MPPKEVPVNRDLSALAPAVRLAAERVLAEMRSQGFKAVPFDTLRTPDRQAFLFGKGRTPEQCVEAGIAPHWAWPTCPDGKVTKTVRGSWHLYGLAFDVVEADATPWVASQAFWHTLGDKAVAHGLTWGGSWARFPDLPHCQWAKCPVSPDASDALLLTTQGMEAVWKKYGAA